MPDIDPIAPAPADPHVVPLDRPGRWPEAPAGAAERQEPRGTPWWLLALTIVLIGACFIMQQGSAGEDPTAKREAELGLGIRPPRADPAIMIGKLVIAMAQDPMMRSMMRSQLDTGATGGIPAPTKHAEPPANSVRTAMVLIGLGYPDVATSQSSPFGFAGPTPRSIREILDGAAGAAAPESALHADIEVLQTLLASTEKAETAEADEPPATDKEREAAVGAAIAGLTDEQREGLRSRHGWFADILMSAGDPASEIRKRAASQGQSFFVGAMLVGGAMLLIAFAGLVLIVIGIVQHFRGRLRPRFERPRADEEPAWSRHVWLETVCIFAGGFASLKLVQVALEALGVGESALLWITLGAQWLLASAIFWPVVRGLDWKTWRKRIGWRADRGVAVEIGCGLLTYMCALPVLIGTVLVMMVVAVIIQLLTGRDIMGGSQMGKVQDLMGSGDLLITIVIALLATVWAPIVEESIFRGALFRHARRVMPVMLAGLVSAMVFAIMHPYGIMQLMAVAALGTTYAVARELRGSLIPSATAHFIQNAFALTMMSALGPMMNP